MKDEFAVRVFEDGEAQWQTLSPDNPHLRQEVSDAYYVARALFLRSDIRSVWWEQDNCMYRVMKFIEDEP
jgi:hypothetical protein